MATICPTVTAENPHQYREQIERIAPFATHVHIDFADGSLTDSKTPGLELAWWPHSMQADLHIMYKEPTKHLETILSLNPRLVIVQSEANGDLVRFGRALHEAGILFGIALLPEATLETLQPLHEVIDHVLLFSGHLGHFGGQADLKLLDKVTEIKKVIADVTIGWDGGINDTNAAALVAGGIELLNVGGFIQRSEKPQQAYQTLLALV